MATSPAERRGPVLVVTKLQVPELRAGTVRRDRLVARLRGGATRRLTLVCAPAGWGKTVLLTQWHAAASAGQAFAWVQIDPHDDDPVRLWRHVIGALQDADPAIGAESLAALPVAGTALIDAVVAPLLNDLDASGRPIVLVLDDYHLVRDRRIHDSIAYLVRRMPSSLRLAIATRADPPLPLARLRAADDLNEIRAADLRFAASETRALLNGSLGLDLAAEDTELLRTRTEGWAAGLQLAALSVRSAPDRHAFVTAFAGDDRQIGDYLHEVLLEQPLDRRTFLQETSILGRMSAALCDAVTGRTDGRAQLEAAVRENLFVEALDTRVAWYRYHQLVAELLRVELVRTSPESVPALHRRAARWYREQGDIDEAIAHATAAGDIGDAAELIAAHWRPVWSRGQFETVARWIDALPPARVHGDARLCLARGWSALYLGDPERCDHWRRLAESAGLPAPLQDGTTSVPEATAILQAAHANLTGDARRAMDTARRALAHNLDPASPSRVIANVHLGMGAYYAGEAALAEAACEEALRSPLADAWASIRVVALGSLAAIHADRGDLDAAGRLLRSTEEAIARFGVQESAFASRYWLARGTVAERAGELDQADAAWRRAATLAGRAGSQLVIGHGLLLRALLARRRGRRAEARTIVREARHALSACPDPGFLAELLARTEQTMQLTPLRERPAGGIADDGDTRLSERELDVLRLLGSDLSQREIGARLFVSFDTVKSHSRSIFRKLGVRTRAEAVARGRETGLI